MNPNELTPFKFILWRIKDEIREIKLRLDNKSFKKIAPKITKPKTTVECLQQYAEKVVLDSNLNLENVLVHNEGQFGLAGRSYSTMTDTMNDGIKYDFETTHAFTPYIIVPEITGWWEFRAWLHEVGHHKNKHYREVIKPIYIQEYEAEIYCIKMAKYCPYVDEIMLKKIIDSAKCYLFSHMETAVEDGVITKYNKIPKKVRKFIEENTDAKEILHKKLVEKAQRDLNNFGKIYEQIFV